MNTQTATTTRRMNRIDLFVPIARVDEDKREVEGFCFVNAECGDGVDLTRSAMKAAIPDYMRWGAVREMHGPSAAGTAIDCQFDDQGRIVLRAKIVDDQAWAKVKERVYKGFSVGVRPTLMRGNKVVTADWIETSLVDRPADADATITLFRSATAAGKSFDVPVEKTKKELKRMKEITTGAPTDAKDSKKAKVAPAPPADGAAILARVETLEGTIKRMKTSLKEKDGLLAAAETAASENAAALVLRDAKDVKRAAKSEAKIDRLKADLERLSAEAAPGTLPIRYADGGKKRAFAANNENVGSDNSDTIKQLQDRAAKIIADCEGTTDAGKRNAGAIEIGEIKGQLAEYGASL